MKPPNLDCGWMLESPIDRTDITDAPDWYGVINIDGVNHPVVGWKADKGITPHEMVKLVRCDWQMVHAGPKWFGLTELQAKEAESAGVEF